MLDGQHEQNRLSDLGIQVSHAIPYRPCESPAQLHRLNSAHGRSLTSDNVINLEKRLAHPHRMLH